jgi:hypothetical protein
MMSRPPPKDPKKKSGRRQAEPDLFKTAEPVEHSTTTVTFSGTDNPRYLRVLHALVLHPMPREQLDRVGGCSNGPALVSELRDLGLGRDGLCCMMVPDQDRDGRAIKRGVYFLSELGRRAINAWIRLRDLRGKK